MIVNKESFKKFLDPDPDEKGTQMKKGHICVPFSSGSGSRNFLKDSLFTVAILVESQG